MMKYSLFLLLFMATGCLVGPNYHRPHHPMPEYFCESRLGPTSVDADDDLAEWWKLFNSPNLNQLIAEALCGNFDLAIALEKVCQARAQYWTQFTKILPEIDYEGAATRSRTSQNLFGARLFGPPIDNFYQVDIDVLWEIDIFGKLRRGARASYFTWEATAEDARNVRIMVLADVAMAYVSICAYQQAVALALEKVRIDEMLLTLASEKFRAGLGNEIDVQTFLATLEEDKAALLSVQISLGQTIYSLATLLGRQPETLCDLVQNCGPIPYVAHVIPLGLPSELICRRPDIRSAERKLAAATEQVGVAVADLFPSFSLTGSSASFSANPLQGANFGFASNSITKLFQAPSRIWGIGILASGFLFDFGKRCAAIGVQKSLRKQACLTYQKTVVAALQEVESDLIAYFNEEKRTLHLNREVEASRRAVELATSLYQAGLADYLQVLQASQQWILASNAFINSQQLLATDLIALYKALGGGWQCSCMP